MSWSASATGRPAAVSDSFKNQIDRIACSEPEQTIKTKIGEIVEAALSAFPTASAVEVSASGSQSAPYPIAGDGKLLNSVNLKIAPLYNFVE